MKAIFELFMLSASLGRINLKDKRKAKRSARLIVSLTYRKTHLLYSCSWRNFETNMSVSVRKTKKILLTGPQVSGKLRL